MIDDGLALDDDLLPDDPAEMLLGAVKFDALSPTPVIGSGGFGTHLGLS